MLGPTGAFLPRRRTPSAEPSSNVTVPEPLQLPASGANGPDWALLSELAIPAANMTAAAIRSRWPRPLVTILLLARCFPPPAARYACRCSIPLPRSGVAAELTVGICTIDRNFHKSPAADGSGIGIVRRCDLAGGNRQQVARRRLAGAALG